MAINGNILQQFSTIKSKFYKKIYFLTKLFKNHADKKDDEQV